MVSKINSAAQDETEIDPLWWKAVDPDFTGQKCLKKLVTKVLNVAKENPSKYSSVKIVCKRIVVEMERKKYFDFVIEDLRCEFRNVADFIGCGVSQVKKEFVRLFAEVEAAERKAAELKAEASQAPKPLPPVWDDYTTDTTHSIVKSENYRKKNSRIHFRRSQILDDLVFKEVNLAYKIWNRPVGFFLTDRNVVIDRILKNLRSDGFFIEDLTEWHYRKVAKFYECQRSVVREEFLRQKDELVIKKEDEHILDLLVPNVCNLMKKAGYLTNEAVLRLFCLNLEVYGQKTSNLKHKDWEHLNKHWDQVEIEEEFHRMIAESKEIKKENLPSPTPPSYLEFWSREDQENYHEEPVAKKPKVAPEPESEEVEDKDSELEEEYQDGYYDDHMGYEEEYHNPQLPGPYIHREDGLSWDYVDGYPAPRMDEEDPALSEYKEEDLQEMELEEDNEEVPEHQDPNRSSWEYMDGVPEAVDEDPVFSDDEELDQREMELEEEYDEAAELQDPNGPSWDGLDGSLDGDDEDEENQEFARVEQEDELQDVRDMFIGHICRHAEKYFNNEIPLDFKKKTSLRWLFNRLADEDFPLELTEGQFDKVANSFNCGRDDIESVFAFYKMEKEFLDNLDEGRPEDQRITDLINEVSTEMEPLSGHHDNQNKFLETFYRKVVENEIQFILHSRQKRRLAAHLGLLVTEIMKQLRKCRDLPKVPKKAPKAPAPKKKIHNNSQTVHPEMQLNPVSVKIAGEEAFWGSLAELEPAETVADREAAVELVEKEKKKRAEELTRTETNSETDQKQIAEPDQPKSTAAVKIVQKERNKRRANIQKHLTRTETYLDKYRKRIAMPYQPKYASVLSKVVEQFAWANNHATKWMPPPVLEAYRTAFLTILYEEIERELNEGEAEEIARFLKLRKKDVDYLRKKEKQFFETAKIEMDKEE